MEKIINNIIDINGWIKSKDKNTFNQDLKNQELELFISDKKANGINKIVTFIIIYLKEYVNSKFIKLKEIILLKIPSNEKTFIEKEFIVIILFKFSTNEEKEIFVLKMDFPISIIISDIKELKYIINLQIK